VALVDACCGIPRTPFSMGHEVLKIVWARALNLSLDFNSYDLTDWLNHRFSFSIDNFEFF
jgi:hypothetical protein